MNETDSFVFNLMQPTNNMYDSEYIKMIIIKM